MGPKKQNKKLLEAENQMDKKEANSKWAKALEKCKDSDSDEEVDASQLFINKNKAIYSYDFSKEKQLYNLKQPPKKQQPIYTPEEMQEQRIRNQKKAQDKEVKDKAKKQKKIEQKKVLDLQKEFQKIEKEKLKQIEQQVEKKVARSPKNNSGCIIYTFLILFVLMGALQYQRQIYTKLSKFRVNDDINYYEVLQTDSGVTDAELKSKYKKLVLKYHPDKNPNCISCKDKFNLIMKAWEILGHPQKRQHYDQNSGFISQIKSTSITLTPHNYDILVRDSDSLWLIQIYDSTEEYCHYFSQFWQEAISKHNDQIQFGRIDVWHQSNMLSFIPYRFQIFPGIYSVHKAENTLCAFDRQRPLKSIDTCVEKQYTQNLFLTVSAIPQIPSNTKLSVVFGSNIKIGMKIKILHKKYQKYFNYYQLNDQNNKILVKENNVEFQFKSSNKNQYKRYELFLISQVKQVKSLCQIYFLCQNQPCIILFEDATPLPKQQKYPVYITQDKQELNNKIQMIKNITGMHEKFDLGLYQNGKIDMGYFQEIDHLNPDNGQFIDLQCHHESWLQYALKRIKAFVGEKNEEQ